MTRPNCLRCGHPVATPDDWRDLPDGGGIDFCWATKGVPCASRLPVIRTCGECAHVATTDFGVECTNGRVFSESAPRYIDRASVPPSWCPLRGAS